MTTLEKRHALVDYCDSKTCSGCILESPVCRCGCGTHFLAKVDGKFTMTDDEIDSAYARVFEDSAEEAEIEECVPDGVIIHIYGTAIDRISNIDIYFKEDK